MALYLATFGVYKLAQLTNKTRMRLIRLKKCRQKIDNKWASEGSNNSRNN